MPDRYNGWANYQTWNVALWIGNDEPLYNAAVSFARRQKAKFGKVSASAAKAFVKRELPDGTPDTRDMGRVRYGEIANMLNELAGDKTE